MIPGRRRSHYRHLEEPERFPASEPMPWHSREHGGERSFTMNMARQTPLTRHLGGTVVAGAIAILLAGSVAPTAEARPRHVANGYIDMCLDTGGDPYYFEYWGAWAVGCEYVSVTTGTNDDDVASEQITASRDRD